MRLPAQDDADRRIQFVLDGEPCYGYAGDTIAAALYAVGRRAWRRGKTGDARGLLCGMGICYDCQLRVDGEWGIRACQMEIREGMQVETSMKDEQAQ